MAAPLLPCHTGYLHVVLSIHPSAQDEERVAAALEAAAADGRLATALAAVGVELVGGPGRQVVQVASAAPAENKATIGAAVGGAIGGAVLILVAAAAFLLMRRSRRGGAAAPAANGGHRRNELPVSAFVCGGDEMAAVASLSGKRKVRPFWGRAGACRHEQV